MATELMGRPTSLICETKEIEKELILKLAVKAVDIFGNDTTTILEVKI